MGVANKQVSTDDLATPPQLSATGLTSQVVSWSVQQKLRRQISATTAVDPITVHTYHTVAREINICASNAHASISQCQWHPVVLAFYELRTEDFGNPAPIMISQETDQGVDHTIRSLSTWDGSKPNPSRSLAGAHRSTGEVNILKCQDVNEMFVTLWQICTLGP